MAKAFSLASWNVEHFKNDLTRVARVVDFVNQQNPDVFALYEVEGSEVFGELVARMPGYQFHITEGQQTQEILVGARHSLTAFFSQRTEFKSGNSLLRPGALLTVTVDGKNYPMLFLHTKSSSKPVGLGLRDDMFERAFKFRKTLDAAPGGNGKANFMFLGDLNTMGMDYPFQKKISADLELQNLDLEAQKVKMRRLTRSRPFSWWNGPQGSLPPSNLDQVVSADHLQFKAFAGTDANGQAIQADVDLRGWPMLPTPQAQGAWIKDFSDHGLLFLEVQKV